ncbi:MAG: hypothetical protein BJ554DRAFT_1680, partial [Olpidium bornovanus]
ATAEEGERLRALSRTGLVVACIAGRELREAREILTSMTQKENLVPPEVNLYAEYLAHQQAEDDFSAAKAVHDEVRSLGLKPSYFLCNVIMNKYAKARKPDMVLQVIREMREHRIKPTEITYGTALNAAIRINNERLAAFIFHEAHLHGFRKNVPLYNMMMQYYVEVFKNRAQVEKIWRMMTGASDPDHMSYAHLLFARACLLPVDLPGAVRLFERIKSPNGLHYAAIICGYAYRRRDFATAEAWLDRMSRQRDVAGPDAVVDKYWQAYEALISSYCAHWDVEGALRVRQKMLDDVGSDEHINHATASILRGCAYRVALAKEGENVDRYVSLAEALFSSTPIEAPAAEGAGAAAAGRGGPEAPSAHRRHHHHHNRALGNVRVPSLYVAMISVYLLAGLRDAADAVYREMSGAHSYPARVLREAKELLLNSRERTFVLSSVVRRLMGFPVFRFVE